MSKGLGLSWIYQARRVATDANAAGNPMIVDVSLASGQLARLISAQCVSVTVATHTLACYLLDEDNAIHAPLALRVTAATNSFNLPSIGVVSSDTNNLINSVGLIIPSAAKLAFQTGTASANAGDTLTIGMVLELFNVNTVPTWVHTRSTDTANITLAANTIAAEITPGRRWT